jgi:uracil-DNA glycosylase family 4
MTTRRLPVLLEDHAAALAACRRCGHSAHVLPIVSSARAPRAMLVGQAPGQVEAAGGRPFAGRAGGTLFRWLASIGLDEGAARERIYIAAVTRCYPGAHPGGRGDRVPSPGERARCAPWLDAELALVRPRALVLLGATAAQQLLGRQFRVTQHRGKPVESELAAIVVATIHPSAVLRQQDDSLRRLEFESLVADLRRVAELL